MAVISFTCPSCKTNLKTGNLALAGKQIRCPKCQAPCPVPAQAPQGQPGPQQNSFADDDEPLPPRRRKKKRSGGRRRKRRDIDFIDFAVGFLVVAYLALLIIAARSVGFFHIDFELIKKTSPQNSQLEMNLSADEM